VKQLAVLLAVLILVAFGVFVWPTPYQHFHQKYLVIRVSRFTGDAYMLDPLTRSWLPCGSPARAVFGDPKEFADSSALRGLSDPSEFASPSGSR
jgi:hypothetical protein